MPFAIETPIRNPVYDPCLLYTSITSLGFELEQGKPRVKEQAEFFYTHLEQPGKKEMPAFMNNNEQG